MRGQDVSLHRRIQAELEARIISGDWPPGHRIPFEVELSNQFGCSRMTVNKVLQKLAQKGLIERRRKGGSFVCRPVAQSAVMAIRDIRSEVEALGLSYSYSLLGRATRKANAEDRRRLGVDDAARVAELVCRHDAGGTPFCLEERLVNLSVVPEAADEPFRLVAPGPWLMERVPWSAAEHRIRAVGADDRLGTLLRVPSGTSCLLVERRTWNQVAPVTVVRLTYPGDSHELVARFEPSGLA